VISLLLVLESQVTSCWDSQETENVRAARTSCPRAPFPGSPPLVSPHSTDRRDLHPEILMLNRAGERTQADHCTPGPSETRQSGASSGPLLAVGLVQGAKDSRTPGSQPPPNEFLGLPCRTLQLSCFGQDKHLLPLDAQSSLELGAEMGLDAMDGAS
jgi:hypothetical protein